MTQNLSITLRTFNRFELKYVLTLQQAAQFKQDLRRYLTPDKHGNDNGRYALSSLYFDSPNLRCYWEKENGIKFRRKLRLRRYETGSVLSSAGFTSSPIAARRTRKVLSLHLCSTAW